MSILARVFVILIFVMAVVYVAVQATLWHHARDWRETAVKCEEHYKELRTRYNRQTQALKEVIKNRETLIDDRNNTIKLLQQAIDAVANDLAVAIANYATVKQDMVSLLNDHTTVLMILSGKDGHISSLTEARDDFRSKFETALRQRNTMMNNLARLTQIRNAYERDLSDLRKMYSKVRKDRNNKDMILAYLEDQGFHIATLVPHMGQMPPPLDSKVVQVSPELGLVLLSSGSDDGVKKGYEFTIYRADKFIAKVIVETVFNDLAGCRVTLEKSKVEEGDLATTRIR